LFRPKIEIPDALKKRYHDAPRPYFIRSSFSFNQIEFVEGDAISWELYVVGKKAPNGVEMANVIQVLLQNGIGNYKSSWENTYIFTSNNHLQYQNNTTKAQKYTVEVEFVTPFLPGEYKKTPDAISFSSLCRNIADRLRLLQLFYGNGDYFDDNTISQFIEDAEKCRIIEQHLVWWELTRPSKANNASSNNNKSYQVKGWVGKIRFSNVEEKYLNLLRLGSQINIGQFTGFGLGHFKIKIT